MCDALTELKKIDSKLDKKQALTLFDNPAIDNDKLSPYHRKSFRYTRLI
ncbi:MAG: hypothetical protein O7D30_13015 [Rickettsia endosymbiont of Ixodes persulcatus]|nr:hypothetical protein [Rickettsia endosymbiont of Ixodes persulcatus]